MLHKNLRAFWNLTPPEYTYPSTSGSLAMMGSALSPDASSCTTTYVAIIAKVRMICKIIKEDIEAAHKYTEAFAEYAKRRVFECDPDLICGELSGHGMVMFVLDKDQSFKLIEANASLMAEFLYL